MQRLVKILETANVNELTQQNIEEYVQSVRSVEAYRALVIDPFEAALINSGSEGIKGVEGLEAQVIREHNAKQMSASQVVMTLEMTLRTALLHQGNGKQMYGVKAFDGVVAMDAQYLDSQIDCWQHVQIGASEKVSVSLTGKEVAEIAQQHAPRLPLLEGALLFEDGVSTDHLNLYAAAVAQEKMINKKIINRFAGAFRASARRDANTTVFDRKDYGGLIVQVKTVPRKECSYTGIISSMRGHLGAVQSNQISDGVFYNDKLQEPRMYISIEGLLGRVESGRESTNTKYRQEVSVLYRPSDARILQR